MKHKQRCILVALLLLFITAAYLLFANPRLRFNQFSISSTTGESLATATPDTPNFFAVKIDALYGYIDEHGEVVIPPRFSFAANRFSDGVARVQHGEKYGYIDASGRWAVPPRFDRAEDFSENLAAVKIDGKYGYIDLSGHFVFPPQFDRAYEFHNGTAMVVNFRYPWTRFVNRITDNSIIGRSFYINKRGDYVGEPELRVTPPPPRPHDVYPFRSNDLWGLSTSDDKVILPPTYDYIYNFSGPLAEFSHNGVRGYLNAKGEVVWPKAE